MNNESPNEQIQALKKIKEDDALISFDKTFLNLITVIIQALIDYMDTNNRIKEFYL